MTSLTLNPLTDKEARELLLEIAPRAERAAEQICKLCGYLPLAIRAAGSLIAITPDLDPLDYAEELKDERSRIERIGKEGVQIGVEASLNLSYARLPPEAARVFCLLSVFPGTFDAAAEEAVCADMDHVSLRDLVRRSLVLYDDTAKRYRLHDLTRLFAAAKLSASERIVGQKRHATYYRDVLAAADDLYLQGGEALASGLDRFDLEWNNIQAGQGWVASQGVEADEYIAQLGMTYPIAGVYVLALRQHSRERIRWLEVALGAAQRLNHREHEEMRWATWAMPTPTSARPSAPSSSTNKHCSLLARLATAEAKAMRWATSAVPTPPWVRPSAPSSSTNKHCSLIARLATAEAKARIYTT